MNDRAFMKIEFIDLFINTSVMLSKYIKHSRLSGGLIVNQLSKYVKPNNLLGGLTVNQLYRHIRTSKSLGGSTFNYLPKYSQRSFTSSTDSTNSATTIKVKCCCSHCSEQTLSWSDINYFIAFIIAYTSIVFALGVIYWDAEIKSIRRKYS